MIIELTILNAMNVNGQVCTYSFVYVQYTLLIIVHTLWQYCGFHSRCCKYIHPNNVNNVSYRSTGKSLYVLHYPNKHYVIQDNANSKISLKSLVFSQHLKLILTFWIKYNWFVFNLLKLNSNGYVQVSIVIQYPAACSLITLSNKNINW